MMSDYLNNDKTSDNFYPNQLKQKKQEIDFDQSNASQQKIQPSFKHLFNDFQSPKQNNLINSKRNFQQMLKVSLKQKNIQDDNQQKNLISDLEKKEEFHKRLISEYEIQINYYRLEIQTIQECNQQKDDQLEALRVQNQSLQLKYKSIENKLNNSNRKNVFPKNECEETHESSQNDMAKQNQIIHQQLQMQLENNKRNEEIMKSQQQNLQDYKQMIQQIEKKLEQSHQFIKSQQQEIENFQEIIIQLQENNENKNIKSQITSYFDPNPTIQESDFYIQLKQDLKKHITNFKYMTLNQKVILIDNTFVQIQYSKQIQTIQDKIFLKISLKCQKKYKNINNFNIQYFGDESLQLWAKPAGLQYLFKISVNTKIKMKFIKNLYCKSIKFHFRSYKSKWISTILIRYTSTNFCSHA